jgi:hypothetical protein
MKIFTNILLTVAFGLTIFNITQLNFSNLFEKESMIAVIGIIASFCAVLILFIFKTSKTIEDKLKE